MNLYFTLWAQKVLVHTFVKQWTPYVSFPGWPKEQWRMGKPENQSGLISHWLSTSNRVSVSHLKSRLIFLPQPKSLRGLVMFVSFEPNHLLLKWWDTCPSGFSSGFMSYTKVSSPPWNTVATNIPKPSRILKFKAGVLVKWRLNVYQLPQRFDHKSPTWLTLRRTPQLMSRWFMCQASPFVSQPAG